MYVTGLNKAVVSETKTGTGVLLPVEFGFVPYFLEFFISEASVEGYWCRDMDAAYDGSGVAAITYCAELRAGEILIGEHLPSIGTTDTQLANGRVVTQHDAAGDVRVETAAVAAGTAFTAGDDITADLWGVYHMTTPSGGGPTINEAAIPMAYASEAEAITNLVAAPANEASLGYITVKATAGAIFDAATDALAGGTTGTPAEETNYYHGYGVMENGILPLGLSSGDTVMGITIGTSALLNVAGSIIRLKAYRS